MRRTPLILPVLGLLLLAPGGAAQDTPPLGDPPPLRAALTACSTGPTEAERFAVFTGSMPARRGTRRMAMRFEVQERATSGRTWRRVATPQAERWERSQPDRRGFVFSKRVERLQPAREYRSIVRFRWYGDGGAVQTTTRRATPVCREPDVRPNLRVEDVAVAPGPTADESRYSVTVFNAGASAAPAFVVEVQGAERPVEGLPAGERSTVAIVARRCGSPAAEIVATADPRRLVDESDERDNALSGPCDGG